MKSSALFPSRKERSSLLKLERSIMLVLAMSLILTGCTLFGQSHTLPTPTPVSEQNIPVANVQVSHDLYTTHVEPYLAVNPRNSLNLLATAQVFKQQYDRAPGTFVSFDGGSSWQDNGLLSLPAHYTTGSNLMVVFTQGGIGFIAARLDGSTTTGIFVWRTDDGGRHFRTPVAVSAGSNTVVNVDHPWMAVGSAPGSSDSALYLVWTLLGNQDGHTVGAVMLSRSFDNGQHFEAPHALSGAMSQAVAAAVVATGPADHVHVVYLYYGPFNGQDQGASGLQNGPMRVVSSSDGGNHFGPPRVIGQDLVGSNAMLFALPQAATDPHDDTLYVSFAAYQQGTHHEEIMLTSSQDDGQTWASPVRANDDPVTDQTDYLLPQLLVTANGSVYVSYFALRRGQVDVYLAQSTDHGLHFLSHRRITDRSWNFALGVRVTTDLGKQLWVGDYQGLAAAPGVVYLLWNDSRTSHLELFLAAVRV
jgi:hypothetical protein